MFCRSIRDHKVRSKANAPGFTLTEVMVSVTLLVLAMVPIFRALTGSYISSNRINYRTNSVILARQKLEEIRAKSVYSYDSSFDQSNASLRDSYVCDVVDTSVDSNLRDVSVTVGYDIDKDSSLDPDEELITLRSLIARRL